jgi:signal transduction histidine kinase
MKPNSLRFRLVVGAALWCVAGFAVGGYALSSLFADTVERGFDSRLTLQLDALVGGIELVEGAGAVVLRPPGDDLFEQPYSGWYWQLEDGKAEVLDRSRSLWDKTMENRGPAPTGEVAFRDAPGPRGQSLRIAERMITFEGGDGIFVVRLGGDRSTVLGEISRFDRLLFWALSGIGIGLIIAVVVQVHVGLRPLSAIGRSLARIRAGEAERLDGEFPEEVAPLAREINDLLAHSRAVVERARTQAGNLAHALKTPLAVLTNEASAGEGPLAEQVARQTTEMQAQIDRHMARARAAAVTGTLAAHTPVAPVLAGPVRVMRRLHQDIAVTVDCPDELAFAGEAQDLEEMFGNLIENASVHHFPAAVRLLAGGSVSFLDTAADRDTVLIFAAIGAGLGLAIVADLAELYDGALDLSEANLGGLSVRLVLPSAQT